MKTDAVVANPHQLGRTLSRLRRDLGLNQEDVAVQAGMHRSYLAGLEGGASTQQLDRLFSVLRVLNCELVVRPRRSHG